MPMGRQALQREGFPYLVKREHGIGIGKKKFMKKEHGESLTLMKQIKRLLDPHGIMNPGKIFD